MPDFKTHRQYGERWASHIAALTLLPIYLSTNSLPKTAFLGALTFTCILCGAVLPDIDSHKSIPRRSLEQFVTTLLLATSTITIALLWTEIKLHIQRLTPPQIPTPELALLTGLLGVILVFRRIPTLISSMVRW